MKTFLDALLVELSHFGWFMAIWWVLMDRMIQQLQRLDTLLEILFYIWNIPTSSGFGMAPTAPPLVALSSTTWPMSCDLGDGNACRPARPPLAMTMTSERERDRCRHKIGAYLYYVSTHPNWVNQKRHTFFEQYFNIHVLSCVFVNDF